jgi:hypothetical protein
MTMMYSRFVWKEGGTRISWSHKEQVTQETQDAIYIHNGLQSSFLSLLLERRGFHGL